MSNQCTLKTKDAQNYKAKKISIEEYIAPKQLKLINTISFEENDSIIINRIAGIEFCSNGKKIVLTDDANRFILLIDSKNGKILKSVDSKKMNLKWVDDFLMCNPIPNQLIRNDLKYIPITDYLKYGLTDESLDLVRMHYFIPKCVNGKLVISNLMYIFAVSDKVKHNSIDNRSGFCLFDSELNFEKMIVPEVLLSSYFLYDNYEFLSNGEIIGTTSNFSYKEKDIMDSIVTVAKYDSTGNFLGNIGYLPDIYTNNNLAYEEHWKPLITSINDSLFILYPRTKDVYGPGQKIRFTLQNIPFSNDSGLVYLYNYYRLARLQQRTPNSKEIGRLLPFSIINSFNTNGNLTIIILVFDESENIGFYYLVQEYDTKGNLLSHSKIYDEPENQIRNFVYDKHNNYMCIVRKSKFGWTLEKREWK